MRLAIFILAFFASVSASAQLDNPPRDAGGVKAPTAALERGRTTFVLSSCHFCHGADLTQAQMGAANLLDSQLVGADVDGNLIGSIVLAGLPNLQTSMPKYDFTPQQVKELAAYVHYLRQQGRYARLMNATLQPGDAAAGKTFADANKCGSCHSDADLARFAKEEPATLRRNMLLPRGTHVEEGVTLSPGAIAHRHILENESPKDEANVLAYLHTLK